MLLCPVRGCNLTLIREPRRVLCGRGHSFDIARSGYINLLQPQDKRSKNPGDTAAVAAARRRLHDRGLTAPMLREISALLAATRGDSVLDAGCGEGFYLGSLAAATGFAAHGADISIPAVDAAARRYPACEWLVANADRALPFSDASFSHVLSITARMNAPEFRRVLQIGGKLLLGVPGPDDLVELRGEGRDRANRSIDTFAENFILREQRRITTSAQIDADSVHDLLVSIYRPPGGRALTSQQVTLSLDLLLFERS